MRDIDDEADFFGRVGEVVGNRLTNALRETIIAAIGLDHIPAHRVGEWVTHFGGMASYNGLSIVQASVTPNGRTKFAISGTAVVDHPIVRAWLNREGYQAAFSFEILSHGLKDELGLYPRDVWPEYAPYGMNFHPLD